MSMSDLAISAGQNVFAATLMLPFMWYFVKQNTKNQERQLEVISKGFKNLEMAIGKHVLLDPSEIVDIASRYVALASYPKIDFIKQRLEKNNLKARKEKVKSSIRTELERISIEQYIKPLNRHNTPVGLLGIWIADNFPMDEFMEEVYDVVFCEDDIDKKISDIKTVMKSYQIELWKELQIQLNQQ